MEATEKIKAIEELFNNLLLRENDIMNIRVTPRFGANGISGFDCIQVRTEKTILRLGTFATNVQMILES